MQTIDQPEPRIADASDPLWFGQMPAAWGDTLRTIDTSAVHDAAGMIAAAGLDWSVEKHPLQGAVSHEYQRLRLLLPRHAATVRSDTRLVLGVMGEAYEPLQNRTAFAFCNAITDSGRAHWIGAGSPVAMPVSTL